MPCYRYVCTWATVCYVQSVLNTESKLSGGHVRSLLFGLSMTEHVAVNFLGAAVPALLRQRGARLTDIGLVYLTMAPWALKFLWAPIVDRWPNPQSHRVDRYRIWLLVLHPILALTLFALKDIDLAMEFDEHPHRLLAILVWVSFLSSTADVASHGLSVSLLSGANQGQRGTGNGFQTAGQMLGTMVGGGLCLISIEALGWETSVLCLSGIVLVPLLGVWAHPFEPAAQGARLPWRDTFALLTMPGQRRWLVVAATVGFGTFFAWSPFNAMLIDQGFSLSELGTITGVIGATAGMLGAFAGGYAVRRWSRRQAFFGFGFAHVALLLGFFVAHARASFFVASVALSIVYFCIMGFMTVLFTMMMDRSRIVHAGTDFTIQYCANQVFLYLGMSAGSVFAEHFGYPVSFAVAPVVFLVGVAMARAWLRSQDFRAEPHGSVPAG